MKDRLEFAKGRNGRGVRLTLNKVGYRNMESREFGLSYDDAAHALFDLKDFLQSSETGRRCLDDIAAKRRAEEVARGRTAN